MADQPARSASEGRLRWRFRLVSYCFGIPGAGGASAGAGAAAPGGVRIQLIRSRAPITTGNGKSGVQPWPLGGSRWLAG